MKKVILLLVTLISADGFAQTMEQEMEKRAREFHRAILTSDQGQWRKFIQENYAKSLIEKPMRQTVSQREGDNTSSATTDTKGTIEDKVKMFERLHSDFGDSKITSLKTTGENIEMAVEAGNISGLFKVKFEKTKPYLINGLGINIESDGR